MSREPPSEFADDETARTAGQLLTYTREMNQSRTVGDVSSTALEAALHVIDGAPSPTVTEVSDGDLLVLESMQDGIETGDTADALSAQAYDLGTTVVAAPPTTTLAVEIQEAEIEELDIEELEIEREASGAVTIATPSVCREDDGVVFAATWSDLETVYEYHVEPLECLADHVATAVTTIRDHQRLERARNDLETRKELVGTYDRILRHDLGNDLQVIAGFSEALVGTVEDDEALRYAETIQRTAESAADLVRRVGEVVHTLEEEAGPRVRELPTVLTPVIDRVIRTYDDLTVDYEPSNVDYQVYAGDLLETVFRNVLSNAAVHNDGPVTVRVYTEEPGPERVVVGFADDGSGVGADVAEDIFELGEKGPDSEGTGLGLGYARAMTEAYGGGVELRESDEDGADFRVLLERA